MEKRVTARLKAVPLHFIVGGETVGGVPWRRSTVGGEIQPRGTPSVRIFFPGKSENVVAAPQTDKAYA